MTPRRPSKSSPLTENSDSSITPRPNSRSSEGGDPTRRSFSGKPFQKPSIVPNPRGFNPVTPANSPSDWAVRGRESNTMRFLRESEEKENETDLNNQKRPAAMSPSITNSKGMKNFMSPTISAASKINASPNKKILTQRNSHEQSPLRSSVALLDLRSSCSSISNLSETLEESETRKVAVLDPTDGTADSFLESDGLVEDMKPSFSSALEPIDADPLTPLPPYDPKTNFLAPRPKFLYYKPKEMDFNPLDRDDGLFSDSFSESEASEETESGSMIETEDAVSSQVVAAAAEEEESAADSESNLHQSHGIDKEAVAVKEREHLFSRSKSILSAFLLLLIASSVMIETDHLQIIRSYNFMINESSFPVFMEVFSKETEYLKSSVGKNLRFWCDFSVSYIGGLMSELRGEPQHGHVTFLNLTILEETQWNDDKEKPMKDGSEISKIFEQNIQIEAEEEEESDQESIIEAEIDGEEGAEDEFELDDVENTSCTYEEVKSMKVEEAVQSGITEEVIAAVEEEKILEEPITIQSGEVEDEEEQKLIFSVEDGNILEESEAVVAAELEPELPQVEEQIPTDIKIESRDSAKTEDPESIKSSSSSSNFLRMTQIAALSSVLLSLVAGYVSFRKIRPSSSGSMSVISNAAQKEVHLVGAKKFNISPVSGINNLMADFDFVGDSSSWPSEISSFPMKEHKEPKKRSGDLSMNPRKSSSRRKESLSASASPSDMSMGDSASPSLSYGSFTTYEMIPSKKRNGDEELVITPLRRSSRLRK